MSAQLYQMQRLMRARRETALKRGCVAIVDIGTSEIACAILKVDLTLLRGGKTEGIGRLDGQAGLRVIGVATTRSRGIALGEITSMEEVERGVMTVIQKAQKMAEVRVDHVIASIAGGHPRSYGLFGEAEVEHGEVSEADIGRALADCDLPEYGVGRTILHAFPVNFTLDHRTGLKDPRGLTGARLTVDMHMLTVSEVLLQNLVQCMRRCDLELSGVVTSAYAAGLASMTEDELELGGACIDLGCGATGLSLYMKRQMIYGDTVRLGGDHITSDICHGLNVPTHVAERLKSLHGGLVATSMDDRDMIEIPQADHTHAPTRRTISRAELIGIMRPRMEEILEDVRDRLDAASFEHMPGRRIVITGGGSQIPGLEDIAARILGRQVRLGRPLRIPGLPQAQTKPPFSALVGMALHLANPQDECWDFEMPADRVGGQRVRKALRWFRENW